MARNQIVGAPSKFTLSVAFFDKLEEEGFEGRRPVRFTVEGPDVGPGKHRIKVIINTLSWEDGSGESWTFEGLALADARCHRNDHVKGWFRTSDRQGWIVFNPQKKS